MKVICIISHEMPGTEPGKFKRFDAGTEYDMDYLDSTFFCAVHSRRNDGRETIDEGRKGEKSAVEKAANKTGSRRLQPAQEEAEK